MEKSKPKKVGGMKTKGKVDKQSSKKKTVNKNNDADPKRYGYILPESISAMADSINVDLSEDAKNSLAEDVTYKLREIIQNCCVAMRNNKRQKLLTSDVNRAFEVANVPPVFGHTVNNPLEFIYCPEADVFVNRDVEVDIVKMAKSKTQYVKWGEEYIKGAWILPDPPPLEKATETQPSSTTTLNSSTKDAKPTTAPSPASSENSSSIKVEPSVSQPKPTIKHEEQTIVSKPPPHFINYYLQVARVVIGGSESHLRVALADLKENSKIGPLTPYFLNLVALTVNKLQRHHRLTDALLRTIEALVGNHYVDPSSHLAVNRAVNAVLVIAIEPKVASRCDDFSLRKRAAVLLNKVLICWHIELKQQVDIVRRLLQLLLDPNISLKSHFGAVVTLTALGNKILDPYFWPIIDRYFPLLQEKQAIASNLDIQYVQGAILVAAESMYRKTRLNPSLEEIKRMRKVDEKLYDYFGDTLIPHRVIILKKTLHQHNKQKASINHDLHSVRNDTIFSDHESSLSLKRCTTLIMIPRHLQMTYNLNFLSIQSHKNVNSKIKQNLQEVFSVPECSEKSKEILFNFVGSNQISCDYIRKRHLDSSQLYFHQTSRLSQLWLHQNLFKNTRSIKYCSPSYVKSSAGNLFMML